MYKRQALDQGREVFSVPGHPFDARASGCNMLIRDGSTLVRSAADVIDALASERPAPVALPERNSQRALPLETIDLHTQILDRLGPSPLPEDQLIRDLGWSASAVSPQVVALELEGKIHRAPGGLLSRAEDG